MTTNARLALAGMALITTACGGSGDGGTTPPPSGSAAVASVSLTPAAPSVLVRGSVTLTATPKDANGNALTGRAVTWSSNNATIATVNAGAVSGLLAGNVSISATSEGVTGSVNLTVNPAAEGWFTIVSGDAQVGLPGRALADSLQIRAFAATGLSLPAATVNWSTATGTASPASTTTAADGTTWVQWNVAQGAGTLTASSTGLTPVSFTATGRPAGSCQLTPSAATQRFSLGPTDYTLSLNGAQPVKVVVLFTDFSDVPASETPAALMSSVVTPGFQMLNELSYGRLNITATAVPTWYRMSQPIGSYTWSTFAGHLAYVNEAMTLADAAVDFSQYNAVYIFAPPNAAKPNSPTFNGGQTNGLTFDGKIIGNGVTFGLDARTWGPAILAHETGHMLGLVDLYDFNPGTPGIFVGDQFRYVGAWSIMSNIFRPGHQLAWEKRKMGWLLPSEFDCLDTGAGVEVVIDPIETAGGVKMIAMPTGPSTALVAEVRKLTGLDASLCRAGVLLYDVDARTATGAGPARIRGARQNSGTCGPWDDATFGFGSGEVSTFTDATNQVSMTVLGVDANGRYRVRFKR